MGDGVRRLTILLDQHRVLVLGPPSGMARRRLRGFYLVVVLVFVPAVETYISGLGIGSFPAPANTVASPPPRRSNAPRRVIVEP
jgi:hypothetical protein